MATQPYHSVRTSKIHGRGVFAKRPIRKGVRVIEYTGPIISTKEADKVGEDHTNGHSHTMLFSIDENRVINGNKGGDARYINHSCDPNCEAVQDDDHIYIEAVRAIKQNEELTYDYHLQVDGKITDKVKKEYACFCGSKNCRGTQIAPEILEKQAKKDAKKAAKKEEKRKAKELKKAKKAEAKEKARTKGKAKDGKKKDKAKEKAKASDGKKGKSEKAKDMLKTKDEKKKAVKAKGTPKGNTRPDARAGKKKDKKK